MSTARLAFAAALLLAAVPAGAARFTTHLDDLAAEVADRDAALTGVLTRDQRREKAAYGKVLAALGGDTTSLLEELKLAGKVSKILEKALPEDPELPGLLDGAVDALEAATGTTLDDLDLEVELEPESAARIRADRNLLKAQAFLTGSALQDFYFQRLKYLQKAIQKTKPVVKFLDAPPPGGGGGGECYPGARNLAAGEFLTATYAAGSFTGTSVETAFQTMPFFSAQATFHRCTPSLHEQFTIFFSSAPAVDTAYPFGAASAIRVTYGSGDPDGLTQVFTGSGSITFTEANAGTGAYAGTFTFTSVQAGVTVSSASFKVTGLK